MRNFKKHNTKGAGGRLFNNLDERGNFMSLFNHSFYSAEEFLHSLGNANLDREQELEEIHSLASRSNVEVSEWTKSNHKGWKLYQFDDGSVLAANGYLWTDDPHGKLI